MIIPLFFNLLLYYGPLWFLFTAITLFIAEFFAEKKFRIGFFSPPSPIYFLTFTILILTLVAFLNYQYYKDIFNPEIKAKFFRMFLINFFLILMGAIYFFFKRYLRSWTQIFFYAILLMSLLLSALHVNDHSMGEIQRSERIASGSPRRMKIIIMEGLSLNFILKYMGTQKMLNFKWIRENGVVGRIRNISPNYELSLLNTLLSGKRPSDQNAFSHFRYQFRDLNIEFDIFPRYILFRNSAKLGLATFYKKSSLHVDDALRIQYESLNLKTFSMLHPPFLPDFSPKNLQKNYEFIQFFSDLPNHGDAKIRMMQKAFCLDDFIIHRIPPWMTSQLHYSIAQLKGLANVTANFYHYAHAEEFSNLKPEQVQKYGPFLERYYQFYDAIIGTLIRTMRDDEMLVIFGLYEAEPLPLWRRVLLNFLSHKDIFVYKPNDVPGLVMMYEKKALKKNHYIQSMSIFDIYPTLCYYAGFPLNRSLPGTVFRDLFNDQFLLTNPVITGFNSP